MPYLLVCLEGDRLDSLVFYWCPESAHFLHLPLRDPDGKQNLLCLSSFLLSLGIFHNSPLSFMAKVPTEKVADLQLLAAYLRHASVHSLLAPL